MQMIDILKFISDEHKDPIRLLVCGDRYSKDRETIGKYLELFWPYTLIHGGCKGVDQLAEDITLNEICCGDNKICDHIIRFEANWSEFGLAAGPLRNSRMIVEGKPDLVLAFHSKIDYSKGTKNMIMQANIHDIPILLIPLKK